APPPRRRVRTAGRSVRDRLLRTPRRAACRAGAGAHAGGTGSYPAEVRVRALLTLNERHAVELLTCAELELDAVHGTDAANATAVTAPRRAAPRRPRRGVRDQDDLSRAQGRGGARRRTTPANRLAAGH